MYYRNLQILDNLIIIKEKVLFPEEIGDLSRFWLSSLIRPFGFLLQNTFKSIYHLGYERDNHYLTCEFQPYWFVPIIWWYVLMRLQHH